MKINERIYSDAEIKLIKEIFDMYIKRIYDEDLEDLINQCKEMFLDNQELMKENKRLKEDNEYLNKVNIELSSRNSKAMKYINEKENNDDNWIDYELLIEPIVLIDILRGSDKE